MKIFFALLFALSGTAFAEPVTLNVNFSLEICDQQPDGSADCTLEGDPTIRVQLDGRSEPSVWSKKMTAEEHDFIATIGLVRYSDGDRLIFRSEIDPNHAPGNPAQVSFKLSDWRKLNEFLFEPEPYRKGTRTFQPRLQVTASPSRGI